LALTSSCTLALHDALPISASSLPNAKGNAPARVMALRMAFGLSVVRTSQLELVARTRPFASKSVSNGCASALLRPKFASAGPARSEEHTSELQSPDHLVCR